MMDETSRLIMSTAAGMTGWSTARVSTISPVLFASSFWIEATIWLPGNISLAE